MAGCSKVHVKRKDGVGEGDGFAEDLRSGNRKWFQVTEGLNDDGYIPGVDLPASVMSKEKVVAMWGKKNVHNGYRYRHFMSNRQAHRVRYLYQRTQQRPIGRNNDVMLKFAIGLLAERDGHIINWCALAEDFCHRRGKLFESAADYWMRLEKEGKSWLANKIGPDTS
jgi:hypothetical protein